MEQTQAPLALLATLKQAFRRRQLVTRVTYRQHDFTRSRVPTLVCGSYLGSCEVTVNSWECFTWINGHGSRMYMDVAFPELVVDEVVRTRAGVVPVPPLPRRVRVS